MTSPHQIRPGSCRRAGAIATAALALIAGTFNGCSSTPRADVEALDAMRTSLGGTPITFRAVGPDGGPLDEPDPSDDGRTLTLADALRRGLTSNPSTQAALARVRIAMADADQSRLLPNPVLSIVLRWGPGKPQIEASLAQDLVRALAIPRLAGAADNRLRQSASEAVATALDAASELRERYASAQAAAALVPVLRERMELVSRLESIAISRLEAGEGTRTDAATFQAERIGLEVELDHAMLTEREERLRLARLIGQPSSPAEWELDAWNTPEAALASEQAWLETALSHRPEIQALIWKLRALGDDEALSAWLPWEGAEAGVEAQRDDNWFAGPSVSTPLPVFDSGQAARAKVAAEQLETRHDLTLARRKVVEDVRVAYQTLAAGSANLERIRRELLPLQEQRRALAEDAYRAGHSDVTALLIAEQDLRLTRAKTIEIEHQVSLARIRLERAVGGSGVAAHLAGRPPTSTSAPPLLTGSH